MHHETWNADLPLLHLERERDQKGGSEKRPWGRYLTIHPSISAYRQYAQFSSQAYFRNEDCLDEAEGRTAPQDEEEAGGRRIGGALLPHEHYGHQLHTRGSHLMWELSQERGAGQLQIETRSTYRKKKKQRVVQRKQGDYCKLEPKKREKKKIWVNIWAQCPDPADQRTLQDGAFGVDGFVWE